MRAHRVVSVAASVPASVATLLAVAIASACAEGPALRSRIRDIAATIEDAQRNGAMRCAPRELALAKSQLEFAEIDLSQGRPSSARAHLAKAEPNAHAALTMSPPDPCIERPAGVAAPP
jgi:OOP family OmpA-OmpF porin